MDSGPFAPAKGRAERSFGTAQDRLVKGLRVAGARTLEEANRYLEEEFVAWWNQHLMVVPASPVDAHRALGPEHDLSASLSQVTTRQVDNDYTIRLDGKIYRIVMDAVPAGLRDATVRIEQRLNGELKVRFRDRYWRVVECQAPPKVIAAASPRPRRGKARKPAPSAAIRAAIDGLLQKPGLPIWKASGIDRTRIRDVLD